MNKPDQQLIDECDPEVQEYIETLESVTIILKLYLITHESDVAHGINDFGDFQLTYKALFGRAAQK